MLTSAEWAQFGNREKLHTTKRNGQAERSPGNTKNKLSSGRSNTNEEYDPLNPYVSIPYDPEQPSVSSKSTERGRKRTRSMSNERREKIKQLKEQIVTLARDAEKLEKPQKLPNRSRSNSSTRTRMESSSSSSRSGSSRSCSLPSTHKGRRQTNGTKPTPPTEEPMLLSCNTDDFDEEPPPKVTESNPNSLDENASNSGLNRTMIKPAARAKIPSLLDLDVGKEQPAMSSNVPPPNRKSPMSEALFPNEGTELSDAAIREAIYYITTEAEEWDRGTIARGLHRKLPNLSTSQAAALTYLAMLSLCEGATAATKYYHEEVAEKGPAAKRYLSGVVKSGDRAAAKQDMAMKAKNEFKKKISSPIKGPATDDGRDRGTSNGRLPTSNRWAPYPGQTWYQQRFPRRN